MIYLFIDSFWEQKL